MAISLIREKKRVKAEDTQIYREGVLGQLSGGYWSLQEGLGRRDEGGKGKSRSLKEKAELKSGWMGLGSGMMESLLFAVKSASLCSPS
ncbi:unnamed protein product, partial [Ilex paraguariensis]